MTVGVAPGWELVVDRGPAGDLHTRAVSALGGDTPAARQVRLAEATRRCVVLGSTQDPSVLDAGRLDAAGLTWARRRSGGSAVMVGPGEAAWVEVVVPTGDPLWHDDVGRASWWLGRCWSDALRAAGWGDVASWEGGLVRSAWSSSVCFAGLGPGEVTVGGRKVIGVSQRRTRAGTLFQCAVLQRWAPAELLGVMDIDDVSRAQGVTALTGVAMGLGASGADEVVESFLGCLPGRAAAPGR